MGRNNFDVTSLTDDELLDAIRREAHRVHDHGISPSHDEDRSWTHLCVLFDEMVRRARPLSVESVPRR